MDKIQNLTLPSAAPLVTWDVANLYTVIPHALGLLINSNIYNPAQISFLLKLLKRVLEENFFLFKNTYYLQLTGASMGSNVTPPYANAFMDILEYALIYNCKLFNDNCTVWHRFIDDAFSIWVVDLDSLSLFNSCLNLLTPGLKFKMSTSHDETPFLDTLLSIQDGHIISDLYRKPTDRNQLLQFFLAFIPRGFLNPSPGVNLNA